MFHTLCAENFNIKSWPNDIVNCKVGFSFALIGSSLTVNYLPSEVRKSNYISVRMSMEQTN